MTAREEGRRVSAPPSSRGPSEHDADADDVDDERLSGEEDAPILIWRAMRSRYFSRLRFSTRLYSSRARLKPFWRLPIWSLRVAKLGSPCGLFLLMSLSLVMRFRIELVSPVV